MSDKSTIQDLLVLLVVVTLPAAGLSQQRDDFIRPFFGYYGSQSLGTAIGNATVAAGQVVPGMNSNPATLGLSRFGQIQVNFQNNAFEGPNASSEATVPAGIYAILPIPVYQGSLAFSGGIQKVTDFTGGYALGNKLASEIGGIYATEFGAAYEAAKDFFLGGSFRYLKGSDKLSISEPDSNSLLNPDYKGYYFTFGFLNRTTSHFQIGASVDLPANVKVNDELTSWSVQAPREALTETWRYTLKRPMDFHVGFSLLYPLWSGFYELEWMDWSGLEFSSNEYFEADVALINREISRDFRSALSHHLGAAGHLPWLPLHLYAGYQYLPAPFEGVYEDNRRQSVSFGASYLLNQQFSLHTSATNYFWGYRNRDGSIRDETCRMVVFGATMHF